MSASPELAAILVDELVRQGVREAVLCPGSRSAPLAYALQDADRAARLRLHVRVDERAAGFLALGLAKGSGGVVPVVTTSGTAVANLHPAVLEAAHGGVALLVLSADRPSELQGTGANQTTRQPGLFGWAPRWSHSLHADLPLERSSPVWRSAAARAYAAAAGRLSGDPGPAHLNLAFREPLVPGPPASGALAHPGRADGRPWVEIAAALEPAAGPLAPEPRTLVVVGDLPSPDLADDLLAMAAAQGWPVVAEPFGGGARPGALPHGSLLLGCAAWLDRSRPRRVVVAGRPTLSRAVAAVVRHPETAVDLVSPRAAWPDPGHVARRVHPWGAVEATRKVAGPVDRTWADAWHAAAAQVADAVGPVVAGLWPSGPAAASAVLRGLPAGSTLFLGSSNAPRDVDLVLDPAAVAADVTVLGNRGLAGIDGCLSTACGVALAQPGRAAYALVGDLTFLHDANGLLVGPLEPRPDLTVVVLDDNGGGIFATLEPGEPERDGDFERVFGTPTGADLAAICQGLGVPCRDVTTPDDLTAAVSDPASGIRVLRVPIDRSRHRGLRADLQRVAEAAHG